MMNFKELIDWLDGELQYCDNYVIDKQYHLCYTPIKYRGIYERIGVARVFDDCGSNICDFAIFKPVEGGTIVYEMII